MTKITGEKLFDYNKHNLVYIGEYIKLADQKASIVLTINVALIGFFINYLKEADWNKSPVSKVFLIIGILTLVLSAGYALFKVLWPRYNSNTSEYMSWGGIAAYSNPDDYVNKLRESEETVFFDDMAKQNLAVAKICAVKYKFLKCSYFAFVTGILISGFAWIFDK
ncbi:hypothetical protein SAMN04487922_13418 [Bacillus toyonensis]|uniref:Pycsar system effector family protein n=1 Tax=Bacillus toyonensis TaxID=155322 RepID=UPI000885C72E|nr:Pycsar system effector family protein [Bacillus toyonensis]SDL43591.1 hypothetical protein SAMN04487922_13418 [Bacillus toyonensis]